MNNFAKVDKLRGKLTDEALVHSPKFKANWDFMVNGQYSNTYPEGSNDWIDYMNAFNELETAEEWG